MTISRRDLITVAPASLLAASAVTQSQPNMTDAGGPRAAPYNLLRNTQFEVFSGLRYGRRWKSDASGLLGSCALLGNSTSEPDTSLMVDAVPSGWKVGHLVKVEGYTSAGEDHQLGEYVLPIRSLRGNVIKVTLPRGIVPTRTGTGSVVNVNIGGSASVRTGDAADYWKKTIETQVWREDDPAAQFKGSLHVLGILKQTAGSEEIYYPLDVQQFRSRQVAFGAWTAHKVKSGPGTYRLFIASDGTNGGTHFSPSGAAAAGPQYLEVTATIPADATEARIGIHLSGAKGDTYHFGNPMAAFGDYLGPNGYTKPREQLIPLVKIEPLAWINATIAFPVRPGPGVGYCHYLDMHADSMAQIARSVRLVQGCIEGINTNPVATGIGGSRLIGWVDQVHDPVRLGNFMSQQVQNVKTHQPLRVPLVDGTGLVFSGIPGDIWSNVSIDIDLLHLE